MGIDNIVVSPIARLCASKDEYYIVHLLQYGDDPDIAVPHVCTET